ncbi:dihydrodipicolinate synthase family protein [Desulforhopalus sp. 52FAK]
MTSSIPEGIIPPLLTPLTEDQHVDVAALRQLIKKQLDANIPALFICGSAGLGSVLTLQDYETVITTAQDVVPKEYPLLCGVLESSTVRSLERIKIIESLGITAFVTVTPYYMRATAKDDLLRHFGTLHDSTDMEMVVYNMPGLTGVVIEPEVVFEMAKRGWTKTIKDSSGDNDYIAELCKGGAEHGLKVYQGLAPDFGWLHTLGASGCVPVPANCQPELFMSAWSKRGDKEELQTIQPQIDKVWEQLVVGTDYISGSVRMLKDEGIGNGTMMLPLPPV